LRVNIRGGSKSVRDAAKDILVGRDVLELVCIMSLDR